MVEKKNNTLVGVIDHRSTKLCLQVGKAVVNIRSDVRNVGKRAVSPAIDVRKKTHRPLMYPASDASTPAITAWASTSRLRTAVPETIDALKKRTATDERTAANAVPSIHARKGNHFLMVPVSNSTSSVFFLLFYFLLFFFWPTFFLVFAPPLSI